MKFILFIFLLIGCKSKSSFVNEKKDLVIVSAKQPDFQSSVYAIVKYSYNNIGDADIVGGICGTAFAVNNSTILTANYWMAKC